MFGICILALVPLRLEPNDRSEQVSQIIFGEIFIILETKSKWVKVQLKDDNYQGWIDQKQYFLLSEAEFKEIASLPKLLCADVLEYITTSKNQLIPIPIGAQIQFLEATINKKLNFQYDGSKIGIQQPKTNLIQTAYMYLNAPYLWGGKSPFGIDCSGFTQMVYKLNGYELLRDASQQAGQGEALSFIEESEPGDLAFFDNDEGAIIHVGIMMENNYIIHASGQVRIDRLDHLGIYNPDTNRHTHKLRVIKKII